MYNAIIGHRCDRPRSAALGQLVHMAALAAVSRAPSIPTVGFPDTGDDLEALRAMRDLRTLPTAPPRPHEVTAAVGSWPEDPFGFDSASQCTAGGTSCHGMALGNHRVEVQVDAAAASRRAVVARVEWRRRLSPRVDFASVVGAYGGGADAILLVNLTVANATATAALVAFEPSYGAGVYSFYYLPYNFSGGSGSYASVFGSDPPPTACPTAAAGRTTTTWRAWPNVSSERESPVRRTSGQVWPANAAWKAADGDMRFEMLPSASACSVVPDGVSPTNGVSCQGWDGLQGWPEFIIFDLGACHAVDGFALWSVGDRVHDPHAMTLDVSSSAAGPWRSVANLTAAPGTRARQTFTIVPTTSRYWRWQILNTCCVVDTWQSFVNETAFRVSAPLPAAGPLGAWTHEFGLVGDAATMAAAAAALPSVPVARFSARTEFDRFTDMERMASPTEVSNLLTAISNRGLLRGYLLFPEHREFAVRDFESIPLRWIELSQESDVTIPTFSATVEPAEFFTFQVGLLATSATQAVTVTGYELVPWTAVSTMAMVRPKNALLVRAPRSLASWGSA